MDGWPEGALQTGMGSSPPVPVPASRTLSLPDLQATARFAAALARVARKGDCITLTGDLGAGKTAFARFFIHAASGRRDDVASPTFNLVLVYAYPAISIWHFDLYRLKAAEETFELGVEDALTEGIALIEWPDRLGPYLPDDRLDIMLTTTSETSRSALLQAGPSWRDRLADLDLA